MRYTQAQEFTGTEAEYRALPGVSASMLRALFANGPEMCKAAMSKDSPAYAFGRLVHSMVLTPENMPYAVYPGAVRRGKEWEAWAAEHADKTIITRAEWDEAAAMVESLRTCPEAMQALTGRKEVSIVATHEASGAVVKGRLDCKTALGVSDYKTARMGNLKKWVRDAADGGLIIQAAMYSALVEALTGEEAEFRFVVQDKRPPYPVGIYPIDQDDLRRGGALAERLLFQWAELERTGWPRHYGVRSFYFPEWAFDGAEYKPEPKPAGQAFGGDEPMSEDQLDEVF